MDGGVTRSGVSLFARWHLRLRVVLPDAESDPGGFTRRSPLYLYYKGWWPEQGLIRGGGHPTIGEKTLLITAIA